MKFKQTLLLFSLFLAGTTTAQTVKWFAGKVNDVDPNTKYNNGTCAKADAYFYNPEGIHWDKNGNMWITEKNKIRLFYNNQFYNRAGNLGDGDMSQSYRNGTGVGGSGTGASFYAPTAIVSDANGVLYIVDSENHCIRKMDAFVNVGNGQVVTTFAGSLPVTGDQGLPGYDDKTGTAARFDVPKGIVRDAGGNMYVTEFNNFTIRKITSGGVVTTLAGKGKTQGTKDGTGSGAEFGGPYGIAQLDANYLVVSDMDNGTIRKVHMTTGEVVTLCGKAGDNAYTDGNFTTARFSTPRGLAVVDGKIYVCDGPVIRVIDVNAKTVSTFAGSSAEEGNTDGEGTAARFGRLVGMAYDGKITLYVTDHYYNTIRTVTINNLAPKVNFTADKTSNVITDEVVTLTNSSTGKPSTAALWTITPNTYSISSGSLTSASPLGIKFTATGFYNVTLKITNIYGKDSLTKNNYISVSTIGIKEVPENVTTGVYPNPSNGSFTLQSLYGNHPIQSYSVTDLTGKVIISKTCDNSLKETFDISNYQNGFYFLRVNTSHGSNTLKIQKN